MLKIREAIVVEGRYDKNTLSQLVDTVILETSGFGIFKDRETLALLRRIGAKRGLILLTDSDGAGFVIRNYLKGTLPPERSNMHISQTASERKSENAGRGRRESLVWRGCLPRYWRPPCAGRGRPFWGKRPPRPLLC